MNLTKISFALCFMIATQALATPTPQASSIVYHCGFNEVTGKAQTCPSGYRCCGPISATLGGTCFAGLTGACPL
ncbi:hypothetical protein HYPSUDRAFT_92286 [Hypholoma sublateritium FD-334 SS-4]|uniref:Uncharacterized protein n=1 Tax=Hypholoma sublateritium (strain FD-334 SS-4) TaxID=945553 RepID=A0A0D2NDD3_HYPSF|nr:hypothetical protein HYPSUDRAFT_92286 [Hypholoma sublateritium FD-334 SS-4]